MLISHENANDFKDTIKVNYLLTSQKGQYFFIYLQFYIKLKLYLLSVKL